MKIAQSVSRNWVQKVHQLLSRFVDKSSQACNCRLHALEVPTAEVARYWQVPVVQAVVLDRP